MATAGECTTVKNAILAAIETFKESMVNCGQIKGGLNASWDDTVTAIDGIDTLAVA